MVKRVWTLGRLALRGGFSLIELLVVIVVVGILASVALQSMTATVQSAKEIKTKREMEMLAKAIVGDPGLTQNGQRSDFGYVGDIGAFPPNLLALYQNSGGLSTWNGPYIRAGYTEDNTGYRTDEWGTAYSYSGGTTINSTGSGTTISKKIADATDDYLRNTINGTILDGGNNPPGLTYEDSIDVVITYPNGSGGLSSKTYQPNSAGSFTLDSIPVGTHPLKIIYNPNYDTVQRYLTVLPRHKSEPSYRFAATYFGGAGPGGGSTCDSSGTLVLRPDGSGSNTDLSSGGSCSANWECVSEVSADDNGSRVETYSGSYHTDTYSVLDVGENACTISAIRVYGRCHKTTLIFSGHMRPAIVIGGTLYQGSSHSVGNSWTDYSEEWTTNPSTGLPWTWDDIDELEAGVSLQSDFPIFSTKCTQVWVEVDYGP